MNEWWERRRWWLRPVLALATVSVLIGGLLVLFDYAYSAVEVPPGRVEQLPVIRPLSTPPRPSGQR